MKKTYYYTLLACLMSAATASAQMPGSTVKLDEKDAVGLTLQRFSPTQSSAPGQDALLRYPLLRLVRPDEPTPTQLPQVAHRLVEAHPQHANPAQVGEIMRAATGRELWGNVTYSNTWESYDLRGFYTFNTASSPFTMQLLGNYGSYYMEGNGGAVFQDNVLYVVRWSSYGSYFYIYLNTFDPETWGQTGSVTLKDPTYIALETATNQATGTTYGVFYNSDATGFVLGTVDYATLTRKDYGALEHPYVALGVTKNDELYGVATDGNLYHIDKATCEETLIGSTGVQILMDDGGHYGQSGEIDPKTGTFYWACKDATKQSALYTVDLTTGAATKLADFPGQETVYGLYVPAEPADDNAPAEVSDLTASFTGNALEGTISFTAPTQTYSGGTLSGSLGYAIMLGNDTLVAGTTQPGSTVTEEVEAPEGLNTFRVATTNSAGPSPESKVKVYVGNDEPLQVTDLDLNIDPETGEANLEWSPVTTGLHNGYIGNVTYNVVRYPDSVAVATDLSATSFAETLSADLPLQSYSYGVVAVNGSQTGKETVSNRAVYGAAVVPPYHEALDNADALDLFTIIDHNADGSTWSFNEREGAASYIYSRTNDGDDWLITPAIQLKGGSLYSLSFEVGGYGYSYLERIEVKHGNQPTVEGMTHTLLDSTDISSPDYTKYTREIAAEADQKVFIGFHAVSPANEYRLYLKNIDLYEGLSLTLPDSASITQLDADRSGALHVEGSFKTPTLTLGGDSLGQTLTKAEVTCQGRVVLSVDHPDTATVYSFTDDQPKQGFNDYEVKVYTTEGEGRPATGRVYVGIDTPQHPDRPQLTDETSSIHLAWNPVGTLGANGGVVKPEEVWYKVYDVIQTSDGAMAALRDSVQATTYDLAYDTNTGDQQALQFGLAAATEAGTSGIVGSQPLIVGKPYALPFHESVAKMNVSHFWWADRSGYSAFNLSGEKSADGDGGCFSLVTSAPHESAWINSGKIALAGVDNPKLYFSHYADPRSDVKLTVEVQRPDGTVDSLYTFDYASLTEGDADQWRREAVSLKAYTQLPYIMVRFRGDIGGKAYTLYLDDIAVSNVLPNDLKATLTAPEQLRKGNTTRVSINVTNKGDLPATRYTAILLADGEEVDAETVEEVLNPMESRAFSFNYTSSLFDDNSTVELRAVVETEDLTFPAANADSATVTLLVPTQSQPESLSAEDAGQGTGRVNLSWAAPLKTTSIVEDDMENYPAWAMDGFGDWTATYGEPKGGAGQLYASVPYPHQGEAFGYMVFDPRDWSTELTDQNPSLVPHSGKRYLASFYNYSGQDAETEYYDSNDWLISPSLSGEAQTISFWVNNVKAGNSDNVELFEVYYSTAGNDTTEFRKLGDAYTVAGGLWQQVSVNLPAGATHFAIRHCTTAKTSFVFMIDDVKYEAGSGLLVGYNLYRDQQFVATVDANQNEWVDEHVPDGTHTYAITAVYAEGESAPTYSQRVTTAMDKVAIADGKPHDVYTTDGRLVARGVTSLNQLSRGTYIINDQTVVVK